MGNAKDTDPLSPKARALGALVYVIVGVLATVLLVSVKLLFEHTSLGRQNEMWVYGKLQGALSSFDLKNPIMLIDISDVPDDQLLARTQEIIRALTELKDRPLAIAVDIDFSPPPNGDLDDEDFLEFCLEKKHQVPIFLAVGRNKAAPPAAWLGQEKYKDLAVAVALNPDDTRQVPLWVQSNKRSEKLNTMNYALALKYQTKPPEPAVWIAWAVNGSLEEVSSPEHSEEVPEDATLLTYGYRLVNYSKLDMMKMAAKKDTSAASINDSSSDYKGMLVIVGDVASARDAFPVPGRQQDQAGSLVMACATYALIKEPVFEFKPTVRLALDFIIAGLIILSVAIIRYRNPEGLFWLGKQALFIFGAIVVVGFLGWLLMVLAGVMWLDFLLVAFALFLHPKVERLIHKIWTRESPTPTPTEPSPPEPSPPTNPSPIATAGAKAAIGLIAMVLFGTVTARAQHPSELCKDPSVAAVVINLRRDPTDKKKKKTCYFRADRKAEKHEMISEADVNKLFSAGQNLFCDKGCALRLWLCGSRYDFTMDKNPPKSYTVKSVFGEPGRILDPYLGLPARQFSQGSFIPRNPNTRDGSVRSYGATAARTSASGAAKMGGWGLFGDSVVGNRTVPKATPSPTAGKSGDAADQALAANRDLGATNLMP